MFSAALNPSEVCGAQPASACLDSIHGKKKREKTAMIPKLNICTSKKAMSNIVDLLCL
jgi:hypothetical protein